MALIDRKNKNNSSSECECTVYGNDGTIHKGEYLDVVVDEEGFVKDVWFRCLSLPFSVTVVDRDGRRVINSLVDQIAGNNNIGITSIKYKNK